MKAVVYEAYGDPEVLQLKEIEKPIPKDHEILIKIHMTTVTSGDRRVRSLDVPYGFSLAMRLVFGFSKPKQAILGTEMSGVVESIGRNVKGFKIGDQVFAFSDKAMGCHAEYKCMSEHELVAPKPPCLTFEEAAALSFGGTTALDFIRRSKLQRGAKILINGASSAVGSAAIQLANHFGAEVTGVCSTSNTAMVGALGAAHVIDYTQQDFTLNGEIYDVIMDTVRTAPISRIKSSLTKKGVLLMVLADLPDLLKIPFLFMAGTKKIFAGSAKARREDLHFLAALAEAGEFRPVIDCVFPLEKIVEAHRYVDTGRKKGNVIIEILKEK